MTNPPIKKNSQKSYISTNVRLPPELHEEIRVSAELNGRSANAEIIARLQANNSAAILSELADLKSLVRKILDQV